MDDAQDREVQDADSYMWHFPFHFCTDVEHDEGRLASVTAVAWNSTHFSFSCRTQTLKERLQFPLGFGNAVVLQTMLSESTEAARDSLN